MSTRKYFQDLNLNKFRILAERWATKFPIIDKVYLYQGVNTKLANNKNRYGGIWKAGLLLHVGYYSYPINIRISLITRLNYLDGNAAQF